MHIYDVKRGSEPLQPDYLDSDKGVGGRHDDLEKSMRVSGYLSDYTISELLSDKINESDLINELTYFGCSWKIKAFASEIGYHDFMKVWIAMSIIFHDSERNHSVRPCLPSIKKMNILMIKRLISKLIIDGCKNREITKIVKEETGKKIETTLVKIIRLRLSEKHHPFLSKKML